MDEVAKTKTRRTMERLYGEQLQRKDDTIIVLEQDIEMMRRIAEREVPVGAYTGHNAEAKIVIQALLTARAGASAWKLKAEEAVRVAKVNEAFSDTCLARLNAVVRYATANFQPLDKHRADLVEICNAKQPEEGEHNAD